MVPRALIVLAALLAGCSSPEPPPPAQTTDKGALVRESDAGNVILHVSNQSRALSPVDITVYLDDQPILSADFHTVQRHNYVTYRFSWPAGPHVLRAVSELGDAAETVQLEVDGRLWGFVGFWYEPDADPERKFTIFFQPDPILPR